MLPRYGGNHASAVASQKGETTNRQRTNHACTISGSESTYCLILAVICTATRSAIETFEALNSCIEPSPPLSKVSSDNLLEQ